MCSQCDVDGFLERVSDLINDEDHKYVFAFDTLTGIRETVERTGHVTPNQEKAVCNIQGRGSKKGGCCG